MRKWWWKFPGKRRFGASDGVVLASSLCISIHGLLTCVSLVHDGLSGAGTSGTMSDIEEDGHLPLMLENNDDVKAGQHAPKTPRISSSTTPKQQRQQDYYFQHLLPHVTDFVVDLYSGRGVLERPGVLQLSPSSSNNKVSFEASPVISEGVCEVVEIYRAYYLFHATFVSPPRCVGFFVHEEEEEEQDQLESEAKLCISAPRDDDVRAARVTLQVTYVLHQCYFGLWQDKTLLVVHASLPCSSTNMNQDDELSSSSFDTTRRMPPLEIVKLEERWNGVPSLNTVWIRTSRRINGLLSWYFTRLFVPDPPTR
jgi:hypothetical protein